MPSEKGHGHASVESDVLAALALAPDYLTTTQVMLGIGRRLAYTTVATTLSRLYAKGAVLRCSIGRTYAYRLPGPRETVQNYVAARSMARVLEEEEDHATVLARFVADLGPEDETVLSELLRAKADAPSDAPLDPAAHPATNEGDHTQDRGG